MSLKLAQKGGTQITAPQQNSAVFTGMQYKSPERNAFNLSKQMHTSMQFGKIYPIYNRMVFPGDTFKIKVDNFVRFSAVISPILNKINISLSAFYVPFRLVWKYWDTFITGGYNNDGVLTDQMGNLIDNDGYPTSTPFKPIPPTLNLLEESSTSDDAKFENAVLDGGLGDFLGYPTFPDRDTFNEMRSSAMSSLSSFMKNAPLLPFMCYQKIINDWFVNNNVPDDSRRWALPPSNISGEYRNDYANEITKMAYVNYGLDYFTSCLPYLQRGDALTFGRTDDAIGFQTNSNLSNAKFKNSANGKTPNEVGEDTPTGLSNLMMQADGSFGYQTSKGFNYLTLDNSQNLSFQYDMNIQELRFLNAMQRWQEKSLRVGTRYIDFLKCYFGVNSSDRSLQRSEFIGSSITEVVKNDIDQTSETTQSGTPLGTVASKLIASGSSKSFDCYCEEHGMIFVMAFVTPETIYKNRVRTELLYKDKEDYYFPEFAHLSPQAVQLQELFYPRNLTEVGNRFDGTTTFGYQDRFNELRTDVSEVHGDFKNNLSFFLQMRNFAHKPSLNADFLRADDVDTSIFATDTITDSKGNKKKVDQIWASFNFDVKAIRPLPKLSTPSLI